MKPFNVNEENTALIDLFDVVKLSNSSTKTRDSTKWIWTP